MEPTHLFELVIGMVVAIIALHYVANRLNLPPSVALLAGGAALAFIPGLPTITVDPELVLVIFLPPLLVDGAWVIPVKRLKRHMAGIGSLAIGAVLFTCAAVAVTVHLLVPSLPWAACAVLGAVVAPPDAVAARAVLERVTLPRRLQILLEGESLLNDASGLVLFRFAVAAGVTGAFSAAHAVGSFFVLAIGGALVGAFVGYLWVKLVRKLGDEYLIIAATILLGWTSYLLGEAVHVSGVIATVVTGLIAAWHQHTVLSASMRMRGTAFWMVSVFLMEAAVFILIGLSLRDIVERSGGFEAVIANLGGPILAILGVLIAARFVWVFGSDLVNRLLSAVRLTRWPPLGAGASIVLSWAGVRGVVTLAMALSVSEGFPGRDLILMTSFVVIAATLLGQGMTLGKVIGWVRLFEPESDKPRMSMSQAEGLMAQAQVETARKLAYDGDGELVHPMLLERYERRATAIVDYVERTEHFTPLINAHFDVVLKIVAAGRRELIRLHRAGEIDDDTLHELERDLDLEELSAISAKA